MGLRTVFSSENTLAAVRKWREEHKR